MISNELVTVVLRQALSMNLKPATEQFDSFISDRLWRPYCKDTKYENRTPDKEAIFRAGCDQRLIQMFDLERFWHHCRRNKGLRIYDVAQQLDRDANEITDMGNLCVQLMVSAINPVQRFLDGSDMLYSPDIGENVKDRKTLNVTYKMPIGRA